MLLWRLFFCVFALLIGWSIYRYTIRPGTAFGWDEASHSLRALQIANDLRAGDWLAFLFDTYRQVYWPPLHSWMCGIGFILAGPSAITSRSVSLILFLLAAFMVYIAALQFRRSKNEITANVATVLFLTAPLAVLYSGQAMLEIPALFFFVTTLCVYLWLRAGLRSPAAHLWLGLAITLTYFARTNYGVLLALVLSLNVLLDAFIERRAIFSRVNLYSFLPLAGAFVLWFAYPPKIRSTWAALVNVPWGMENPYSLEGFLFYPGVLLHLFGPSWLSIPVLVAFIVAFKYWRDPRIRFLLILVIVYFGLSQLHHQRVERHMLPLVPPLALLAGFISAEWWTASRERFRWLPCTATFVLCLGALANFPTLLQPVSRPAYSEVADSLAEFTWRNQSTLLLGVRHTLPSPPLLDWQLVVKKKLLGINQSGIIQDPEENRKLWRVLQNRPIPSSLKDALRRVVLRLEEPARLRSVYLDLYPEDLYSKDPEKLSAYIRTLNARTPLDQLLFVRSTEADNPFSAAFIEPVLSAIRFVHLSTCVFPEEKIELWVCGPASPSITSGNWSRQ